MPSLISQMRNAQMQQSQPQQISLNNSIAQAKQLMQQIQMAKDKQQALIQMLQNNPNSSAIAQMLRSGNSLESIARSLAAAKGVDINDLINQLKAT